MLVEEFPQGPEVSLFFVSDGRRIVPLSPAQVITSALHTTGAPIPEECGCLLHACLDSDFVETVTTTIAQPVIDELAGRGTPFIGLLYGLIVTDEGTKVIEFNARFGDPETQVVLARLESPLAPLPLCRRHRSVGSVERPRFSDQCALTVVLASEGYPENPVAGREIQGLDTVDGDSQVTIAHAATAWDGSDLLATGGRVLSIIAPGPSFDAARDSAYGALDKISLEGSHYRRDIALSMLS